GGGVVDRLADGADRLRKILYRVMARHITGLEMHLRDSAIVACDEAEQDLGEEAALLQAQPPHDSEIDRDEATLIVEEQIARMHVGVEEAVTQRVPQETLDHLAAEVLEVDLRGFEARMIRQRHAVNPVHR